MTLEPERAEVRGDHVGDAGVVFDD